MQNHCVFYRTNLKFDGRVCSLIQTLSESFPNDIIYLYEYPLNNDYYNFPSNVKIIKPNLFFSHKRKLHLIQLLKALIYNLKAVLFLIRKKPSTIQVHHDVVVYCCIFYKFFFKSAILVYNDAETYYPKDKNITVFTYLMELLLIKLSDLLIIPNEYRRKSTFFVNRLKNKKFLIIDNYVFQNGVHLSDDIFNKLNEIKKSKKNILVHQSEILLSRRSDLLEELVSEIPDDWVLCFIGITDSSFINFYSSCNESYRKKLINIGRVNYEELTSFYNVIDGSIIFYNSSTFNNNYCAPNRLYIAANCGVPIIVNDDNYTLSNFVKKTNNGITIRSKSDMYKFFDNYIYFKNSAEQLKGNYEYHNIIPELKLFYLN